MPKPTIAVCGVSKCFGKKEVLRDVSLEVRDEPTVGIDPVLRLSIWDELRRYAAAGASILMTTHVMDEAERCTRVALLRDGTILAEGPPDDLKKETGKPTLEGCFLYYGGVR
jgi:ABC-2 type transport system ATP-binding protein